MLCAATNKSMQLFEKKGDWHVSPFFLWGASFGGHESMFGATDTPVLNFWRHLLWVLKPEWAALLELGGGVREIITSLSIPVADPGFSRGDANPWMWAKTLVFCQIFAENCMKIQKGGKSLAPPDPPIHNPPIKDRPIKNEK